jgi:hypothetical protein
LFHKNRTKFTKVRKIYLLRLVCNVTGQTRITLSANRWTQCDPAVSVMLDDTELGKTLSYPIFMNVKATIRALDTDWALAEGLAELGRLDPVMARLVAEGARPVLRKREPGFHGLAWIVMGQQLSVASADAIWKRLVERVGPLTQSAVEAAEDEALKACGLSAPKIRTLRAIAAAIDSGILPLDKLGEMPADAAHAALTAVKGFGPWTADIYLMFSLGHADAFAAGDLALQRKGGGTDNSTGLRIPLSKAMESHARCDSGQLRPARPMGRRAQRRCQV